MIGISLDLRHNSGSDKFEYVSSEDIFDWHDRGIGGGMFLRQYLMMTERFGGFLQGNLNYLLSEYKSTSRFRDFTINNEEVVNDQKRLNHTFSLNVYLGLYYFITDRWSIETRLGAGGFSYSYVTTKYNFDSEEDDYDSTVKTENSSFSVDFINQINFYQAFTINYYF